MGNETALIKLLTALVSELREIAEDLDRTSHHLSGDVREQVRSVHFRVEALRRHYEHLESTLESAEAAEQYDDTPKLKPAAGAEPL